MNYLEDVRKLYLKDLTEISKMNFSSSASWHFGISRGVRNITKPGRGGMGGMGPLVPLLNCN